MANELVHFRAWMDTKGPTLGAILGATSQLIESLQPHAAARGVTIATLVNDDAVTVRALLDGVNLAAVAGGHGVSAEDVIEGLGQVLGIASLVSTLF